MSEYLSRVQQSSLIQLYHAHPVLWQSTHRGYKDHKYRDRALATMQMMFDEEWGIMLDIRDIKTKIQSFRTSVSREMSKISRWKSDAGPNDVYKPSYAHWHELQFLTSVIKKRDPASDVAPIIEPDNKTQVLEDSMMSMGSCSQQDDTSFQLSTTSIESPTPQSLFLVQAATPPPQPVTIHVAPIKTEPQPVTSESQPTTPQPQPVIIHVETVKTEPHPTTSESEPTTTQPQPVTIHMAPVGTQAQPTSPQSQPVTIHTAPVGTQAQPTSPQSHPVTIHVAPIDTPVQPVTPQIKLTPPQVGQIHSTTQQGPTSSSTTNSTNKRRTDAAEESTIDSIQQYPPSKYARVDSGHSACGIDERYMVWAKNLIEQLKLVHNANKRIALQIQINRLVQDEIMREIDQE